MEAYLTVNIETKDSQKSDKGLRLEGTTLTPQVISPHVQLNKINNDVRSIILLENAKFDLSICYGLNDLWSP